MAGRQLRDRDVIALDLVGVAGLVAFLLGLVWLRTSKELGFDPSGAIEGVLGQLSVTLPAALLVLAATGLELATGLILARAVRRGPFESIAESLLAAMVAAVLKDALLLGLLGGIGLFRAPVLIGVNVAVIVGAWLPPLSRRVLPLTAFGGWRDAVRSIGSVPVAALVAIVWTGPIILQLASPVVPFIDVLPNYVGPVEHLRTFGWFSPLTATQSPIIGPSRTVLGYDGLLGSLATMTGLPGGLAIAAFILPLTILLAAAAYRMARAIWAKDPAVGIWTLVAFPLSQPFARLADARGTVVVVPLVCLGLAVAAEAIASRRSDTETRGTSTEDPWRIGRGAVIGLSLGSATLVHPVIGFLAVSTVGIAALVQPRALAADAFVATLTAGLIALPQLATMVGISLPTLALGIGLPAAVCASVIVARAVSASHSARGALVRLAQSGRIGLLVSIVAGIPVAVTLGLIDPLRIPEAIDASAVVVVESGGLLLVAAVVGALLGSRGARSPIVISGLVVGVVAVLLAHALPATLGFLGDALRFEVPKTVRYWLSVIAAAAAASGLAVTWSSQRLPRFARVGAVVAFVVVAALPLRGQPIYGFDLLEHRWSESFAVALDHAETGFWLGFPDSRTIVDEPRQEILDAIRAEIDAGRIEHNTPVLHVASSFQHWVATPLGVFDGVNETFVSEDPEVSHQTVGGRLFGLERLDEFLGSGQFPYAVLEPRDLPDGTRERILAAGYSSIFANEQGEVFRIGG